MSMKSEKQVKNQPTQSEESLILQLIRRGDRVSQIARIVGVRPAVVENVLDQYVCREMEW